MNSVELKAEAYFVGNDVEVRNMRPLEPFKSENAVVNIGLSMGNGQVTVWLEWPQYTTSEFVQIAKFAPLKERTHQAMASAIKTMLASYDDDDNPQETS